MGAMAQRRVLAGVAVAVIVATMGGCGRDFEWDTRGNDRIADVVAVALGSPRPISAASLQRHIATLPAGADGRLEVLEAVDLEAKQLTDPLARMLWRVTTNVEDGFSKSTLREVVTCYEVHFSYYGAVKGPNRAACPAGAAALDPPPATGDNPIGVPVAPCYSGSGDCPGG